MKTEQRKHAIVIGGSMAGLLAARVLSDHFERVTILERDPVNDQPETRKGQPQTRHTHILMARGRQILEQLFPGIEETLINGGAVRRDFGAVTRWYVFGNYRLQHHSGVTSISMSRPFLEWHVRSRVLALPNVTLLSSSTVEGLAFHADNSQVTGVQVAKHQAGSTAETLHADLVIDAAGRGTAATKWLETSGYTPPPEQKVTVRVGYATRTYRRRPDDLIGAEALFVLSSPAEKCGGILIPIEGDRWQLTLGGVGGFYPPQAESDFLQFAHNLPTSDIYDFINRVEPLSDIVTYKFPANLRRHYEKLKRFPNGYLVLGDAAASFDPVYGQGMTSAAMQAMTLHEVLAQQPSLAGLWQPYFKRTAKVVDIPWNTAVLEDFRIPETEGKKPPGTDLLHAYTARLHQATHHDPVVYSKFLQVMHMLAPASSLLHPRLMWRVLRSRPQAGKPQQEAQPEVAFPHL